MKNKIIFLGMGLDSANRGVNALCIGAVEIVKSSYDVNEITLISFRKADNSIEYTLSTRSGDVKVINKFFSKKDLLTALRDVLLFKSFGKEPTSRLSSEMISSHLIFDLNEGDSFSDIYGFSRILRHFLDSFLAISLKKNLIFLPQTIGPFNTFIGKNLGLYILKKLKKLYIRDDKAINFLEKNSIKYIQTIDVAVYMKPKKVNIEIPKQSIMININGLMYFNNYKSLKGQFEEYKNILFEIVKYFQSINKHIVFVPHTYDANFPISEDDLEAIKDFVKVNSLDNITTVDKNYDAQELKYIISQSELFLGSRMHSCIAALSTSVPTIALAYSYKFKGTFNMFGLENTVIEINNLQKNRIDEILNSIKSIYIDKDTYIKKLIENNKREVFKL
jgi:polysaccharide pyruvyl transferase WcaK-like protein